MPGRPRSDSAGSDASTASTGSTKSVGSDHSSVAAEAHVEGKCTCDYYTRQYQRAPHTPLNLTAATLTLTYIFIDAGRQVANATAAAEEGEGGGGGEAVQEEDSHLPTPGGVSSGSIASRLGPSSQSTSEREGESESRSVHVCDTCTLPCVTVPPRPTNTSCYVHPQHASSPLVLRGTRLSTIPLTGSGTRSTTWRRRPPSR